MCILHKWSKWEQYVERGLTLGGTLAPKQLKGKSFRYTENRQRRVCKKCGKTQDELY